MNLPRQAIAYFHGTCSNMPKHTCARTEPEQECSRRHVTSQMLRRNEDETSPRAISRPFPARRHLTLQYRLASARS